ncbi:MAG: helix-turn-helix domain-containing protein, partial [Candidatus Accumulibacter sp.]|nr:helix-turn-helix domain-containing protein [Accumulibacter sp.]
MANARLTAGQPQRQVAAELGLARSTLQAWRKSVAQGAAPVVLAAWVETPEGVQWLHQLVLAAHFCITLQGGAGIRVVCQFLELSGLSAFVGASYGAHQGLNAALEEAVVAIASEQRAALGQHMAHRQITVCE